MVASMSLVALTVSLIASAVPFTTLTVSFFCGAGVVPQSVFRLWAAVVRGIVMAMQTTSIMRYNLVYDFTLISL